ncbi:MAG: hypothetical protein R3199_07555 [Gemmatimonadota bacterium]|nr:hypothetical protein [Gemmatimonadota bacterium]
MSRGRIAITTLAVAAVVVGAVALRSGSPGSGPPDGEAPMAGISKRIDPDVVPLAAAELEGEPGARALRRRCAGCHDVPGPRTDPDEGWARVLDRMEGHIEDTGLLPLMEEDREAILEMMRRRSTAEPAID